MELPRPAPRLGESALQPQCRNPTHPCDCMSGLRPRVRSGGEGDL